MGGVRRFSHGHGEDHEDDGVCEVREACFRLALFVSFKAGCGGQQRSPCSELVVGVGACEHRNLTARHHLWFQQSRLHVEVGTGGYWVF